MRAAILGSMGDLGIHKPSGESAGESDELTGLLGDHVWRFGQAFGSEAEVRCFFSPGRVNLMGAHLDYNGGPVMPMAIDRGTLIALRERDDRTVRLRSTLAPETFEGDLAHLPTEASGRWSDYPVGVLRALAERSPRGHGFDVLFGGNLPIGAGLSSSASICVGTAHAVDAVWGLGLEPLARVQVALQAERGFVGVHCGIMDPFAVGLALPDNLLWLDCKDRSFEHLPLDTSQVCVVVADTGVRRQLAKGAFNQRVAEARLAYETLQPYATEATCLRDISLDVLEAHRAELTGTLEHRARHVLEEVQRTFEARDALRAGDLAGFGARMTAAHASLREHYEVSVPELDCLVDAAVGHPAVLGSRLTGAGFGGCVVILARREYGDLEETVAATFEERFGTRPKVEFFGGDPGPREAHGPW